jgi:hypothetical protein
VAQATSRNCAAPVVRGFGGTRLLGTQERCDDQYHRPARHYQTYASEPATVRALEVADGIPLLPVKGAAGCFAGTFPPTQDLLYRGRRGPLAKREFYMTGTTSSRRLKKISRAGNSLGGR